jgi:hypothetical protein
MEGVPLDLPLVGLTWHNPNTPVLAEGPEISIKPVGIRRVSAGETGTRNK